MQVKNDKTLQLSVIIGLYIKELRQKKGYFSRKKFADEYDLSDSNLSRIERGLGEIKFVTLFKILQSLDISLADFETGLKERLGSDFTLIDI